LRDYILESGLAQSIYLKDIENTEMVYEYLSLLINLDFAKTVENKYTKDKATIFTNEGKFAINIAKDDNVKFISDLSLLKTQNYLLENLGFELGGNTSHFLTDNSQMIAIREQQELIQREIDELQQRHYIIKNENLDLNNRDEILKIIFERINELNQEYKNFNVKIHNLSLVTEDEEKKNDDGEFEVGDVVRIVNSGIIARIVNINTITKEYSVLTDENDTISVTVNQIVSIEDDLTHNLKDIEDKAKAIDGAVKAQNIEEADNSQGSDDFTGYGVKDDFKSSNDKDGKNPIDKEAKFNKEDSMVLNDVSGKLNASINSLEDLAEKLRQYNKINKDPLDDIINKIKSFKEAIDGELNNI